MRRRRMYARAQSLAPMPFNNTDMTLIRWLVWIVGAVAALVVLIALWIALVGWNWLREPIQTQVMKATGRALAINGDLQVHLAWPQPRLQAAAVTFANPTWSKEKYLLRADTITIAVDLPALLMGELELTDVDLSHPTVLLEQSADGRKNWLLDVNQQDENARIHIAQLTLDDGTLGYDDASGHTHIRANLTSAGNTANGAGAVDAPGVVFRAQGTYHQLPMTATGTGGSVLALRDERTPYPLTVDATFGQTHVKSRGTVTSLSKLTAVDMQLALSGNDLEQLYPLLGIPAPKSRAYAVKGHLSHFAHIWRFENFTGHIGGSDMAGAVVVTTGGKRPELVAKLNADMLDLDDLAAMIGARATPDASSTEGVTGPPHVLPDVPFKTDRWSSMNADVRLHAKHSLRAQTVPMDDLTVHLGLRDAVLTLEPLEVVMAGGHLKADVVLDGRTNPIQAKAHVQAHKVLLSKLFPTLVLNQASIGDINGSVTLTGKGNSVGKMLGTANGNISMVIAGGEVSQLMMEKAGLHLWEMLALKVSGDKRIVLRCAVADFDVNNGVMEADALIFDTQVTTLLGSGTIDLAHETLDLTLHQRTKRTSPLALRSPILIHGNLAHPTVGVDKAQVAVRAAGAAALGLISPLLALVPLVDPGPGEDSDCTNLLRDAKALHKQTKKDASAAH